MHRGCVSPKVAFFLFRLCFTTFLNCYSADLGSEDPHSPGLGFVQTLISELSLSIRIDPMGNSALR